MVLTSPGIPRNSWKNSYIPCMYSCNSTEILLRIVLYYKRTTYRLTKLLICNCFSCRINCKKFFWGFFAGFRSCFSWKGWDICRVLWRRDCPRVVIYNYVGFGKTQGSKLLQDYIFRIHIYGACTYLTIHKEHPICIRDVSFIKMGELWSFSVWCLKNVLTRKK